MNPLRIAIHGAAGRMGRRLVALGAADSQLAVVAAVESAGHPLLGQDAGTLAGIAPLGIALAAELTAAADVMVDFSVPAAVPTLIETCRRRRLPLVVATTGLGGPQLDALRTAAKEIPLVWSPNMSLAVNLTMKLCETAAKALAAKDVDVEILERHHRFKEDAPSGTALRFGEIIAGAMGQTAHRHGRQGRPESGPTRRSATMPSAWATIPASTPSSSACWARRSSFPSARPTAIATPWGRWSRPSFWPARPPAFTA